MGEEVTEQKTEALARTIHFIRSEAQEIPSRTEEGAASTSQARQRSVEKAKQA